MVDLGCFLRRQHFPFFSSSPTQTRPCLPYLFFTGSPLCRPTLYGFWSCLQVLIEKSMHLIEKCWRLVPPILLILLLQSLHRTYYPYSVNYLTVFLQYLGYDKNTKGIFSRTVISRRCVKTHANLPLQMI